MATVVLIRGLMRDKRHWADFSHLLQNRLPVGHQVLSLDTLGNGDLASCVSPLNIDDYAKALLIRLRRAISGDCYIVGLSMGAMIALQMASLQGESVSATSEIRIKAVALLNASAANLSPCYHRFRLGAVLSAFPKRAKGHNVSALEALIIALTSVTQHRNLHLARQWTRYRAQVSTSFTNVLRQLWASSQFTCPSRITVPIILVCGEQDKLVSPSCSRKLARYYQSKLVKVEHAGHDLSLDCPEKLCQVIIERFFPQV